MSVRDLLTSARLIGAANSARAVRGAAQRLWQDRTIGTALPARGRGPARVRAPGLLRQVVGTTTGVRFSFTASTLRIAPLVAGGVFVSWDDAAPLPTYALAPDTPDTPVAADATSTAPEVSTATRVWRSADCWIVETDHLRIQVGADGSCAFSESGSDTRPFRRDLPPWWIGTSWTHRSIMDGSAGVFGFGGRSGALNRVGRRLRLWNREPGGAFGPDTDPLSITMPGCLIVDDHGGHLAFYDNSHDGNVDIRSGAVTTRLTDGALRYYVLPGAPADALDRYTELTGRPALPPRWALGYHQSRWDYPDQTALQQVVDGFDQHGLGLSGLWLDIEHLVDRRVFTINPATFPDLPALARRLEADDAHLVSIVDPGVKRERGLDLYEQGRAANVFCTTTRGQLAEGVSWPGTIVYPDFTNARARVWWSRQYQTLVDHGIHGCWHDMNEPSSFVAFGDPTLPRTTRHELEGRGGDHREAHNVYGMCMARAGYQGMRQSRPGRRPFLISRSGWIGMQRYGGSWSGDIETSWAGLRASLAFTLGLGLSGVPFSGPDVGGFTGHPTAELYLRWLQLSAYLPFFRTHCARGLPPREPWAFGPEVLAHARSQLRERYRLLPYWYTLAWQAHRTGAPYVRPLWWSDPTNAELRQVDDVFLLGDALLVAPVLNDGARTRDVTLPAGRWYDRRDGTAFDGPGVVRVEAPVGEIPTFARAGAVLPVSEDGQVVLEAYHPPASTHARVPPGAGGLLVSDAGDGDAEPRDERFILVMNVVGGTELTYDGPAPSMPYPVRWLPTSLADAPREP